MGNQEFNWAEVETKIHSIWKKFDNIPDRYRDDFLQTLRIHAYYKSTDYYDLMRRGIDFWRKLQTREKPEVPYFDLEVFGKPSDEILYDSYLEYDHIMELLESELNRPGYGKWDNDMLDLSKKLLQIICDDIDARKQTKMIPREEEPQNHYVNYRLNLSWVSEETGIGYKRVVVAMKFLEDLVRGLAYMRKIEIPPEYLKGYFD